MVCPPRGHVFIWCDDFYGNCPFGCRGEHCSPAAFTRCIANAGAAARAVNDRPYGVVIFYCPVGRGDPTPPCNLPVISHYRCSGNGRHICRPYKATRKIIITIKPQAGQCPAPAPRFLNVPAARALLIYYLLSFIFYLLKTTRAPAGIGGGAVFLTAPWTKMPSGARFRGLQKIPAGACPP